MVKIIRHVSYILCMFVVFFGTVNACGDLFVRSAKIFQAKIRVMVVCLHMQTAKSYLKSQSSDEKKQSSYSLSHSQL